MPGSPEVIPAQGLEPPGRISARIAARIAHDLNNSLAILSGHLFLLRDGAEPLEEGLDAMEKAAENIERMARGLTGLGSLGIDSPAPVQLNDVVRTAIGGGSATVETDLDPGLPAIETRAADVERAIRALMENAREASAAGSQPVRISTKDEGSTVSIAVEDSGAGVPAEIRRRRFDPLFSTKGERGRGLGVTLAIVAATIAGGSLEIQDRPAGGTRAILRIPKTTPRPFPESETP